MEEELAKKAEVLKNLALVSSAQSDYDASLGYAESALELYEKLGDKQNVFRMHMNIQQLYMMGGAWDGAREDKALKHLEAIAAIWRELRADLSRDDPMFILAGPGADMDRLVGLAEEFVHARNGHTGALV